MPAPALRPAPDAGFTMIEVLTVIALMGIALGFAVSGWVGWTKANEQQGAATEIEAVLRDMQQRAVTEGSSTCVMFDATADAWTSYRGACTATTKTRLAGPVPVDSSRVHLANPSFSNGSSATLAGVTFSPRGSASQGSVLVTREGTSHRLTVSVEGVTGRVVVR